MFIDEQQAVPSSTGRQQAPAQQPSGAKKPIGVGQRSALTNIADLTIDPVLQRQLKSGNPQDLTLAFQKLEMLYRQSQRDPSVLAGVGISKADLEAAIQLFNIE